MVVLRRWWRRAISARVCDAQLGVEVGERLVHEEHGGLADDGAAERDALALAAGELLGLAVEQVARARGSRPPP